MNLSEEKVIFIIETKISEEKIKKISLENRLSYAKLVVLNVS